MGSKEAVILGGAVMARGRGSGVEAGTCHGGISPAPRLVFTAIISGPHLHFHPLRSDCYRHTYLNFVDFLMK